MYNKVRFRLVIAFGDFIYVDGPPRPLTAVERRAMRQDGTDTVDVAVKLLPNTERLFRVRVTTDSTVVIDQDGVSNSFSTNRVTKMPPRAPGTVTAAPPTDTEQEAEAPTTEYVMERLDNNARPRARYLVRWYGYPLTDDTYEPAEELSKAFIDCYWKKCATVRANALRAGLLHRRNGSIFEKRQPFERVVVNQDPPFGILDKEEGATYENSQHSGRDAWK